MDRLTQLESRSSLVLWACHRIIIFDLPFLPSASLAAFIELTLPIEVLHFVTVFPY